VQLDLLSIITPSFNRVDLIEKAIKSVLDQDYPFIEHLVIDGGSTDGTLNLLVKYPHLKVVSEPDKGMYDALNKGLKLAHGEIIGFLNTDDFYAENIFEEVAAYFANPTVDAVAGRAGVFRKNKDGSIENVSEISPSSPDLLLERTIMESFAFNAWFFRRSVFEKVGTFDAGYRIIADREFMIRVALSALRYKITDSMFYLYLQHEESLTFNKEISYYSDIVHEMLKMTDTFQRKDGIPAMARRYLRKRQTRDTINLAAFHLARLELGKAWFFARAGILSEWNWPLKFVYYLCHALLERVNMIANRIWSLTLPFREAGARIIGRLKTRYQK
jgi:glycosyltransferase involved in cell wall biosynthesis